MTAFERTERNRVRRLPERGKYDPATIYPIIDEALICHVGFVQDGQPFVIPTLHARDGDCLLLHGATTSRLLKHVQAGHEVCASITLVDGLVLARSVFHHSINYRSVVVFGSGQLVEGDAAKLQALERFTERLLPGRWADARQPNPTELKATSVVSIPMASASAKVRVGPPGDDDEDLALPIWAGVLPMQPVVGTPLDAPNLDASIALPDYIREYVRRRGG